MLLIMKSEKGMIKLIKFKTGDVVKRNGNFFKIKRTKDGHLYTALLLGNATVTAWHRTTQKHLLKYYTVVENYDGDKAKFEF